MATFLTMLFHLFHAFGSMTWKGDFQAINKVRNLYPVLETGMNHRTLLLYENPLTGCPEPTKWLNKNQSSSLTSILFLNNLDRGLNQYLHLGNTPTIPRPKFWAFLMVQKLLNQHHNLLHRRQVIHMKVDGAQPTKHLTSL